MKAFSVYMLVLIMLMMSIVSTAHANCAEGLICEDLQQSFVPDEHNQDNNSQETGCDCCSRCAGHHHATLTYKNSDPVITVHQLTHDHVKVRYLSRLHYPPSKPPKS